MTTFRRRGLATTLALLVPATLACNSASRDSPVAEPFVAHTTTPEEMPQADAKEAAEDVAGEATRMVIHRASLELRADDPSAVIAFATNLSAREGGYVASSSTRGVGNDVERVDATLRVPADRFEGALAELRAQGSRLHETRSGEDVTEEYTDLNAHLRSKRTLEERLLAILSTVQTVDDALSVETQLTAVRTEVERLEGRKRIMSNRVSLATIELTVSTAVQHNRGEAESVFSQLHRALGDAGSAFITVFAGLIRVIGVVLPLGLVVVPIALGARQASRRRRRPPV